jgi:hypothetical protein
MGNQAKNLQKSEALQYRFLCKELEKVLALAALSFALFDHITGASCLLLHFVCREILKATLGRSLSNCTQLFLVTKRCFAFIRANIWPMWSYDLPLYSSKDLTW